MATFAIAFSLSLFILNFLPLPSLLHRGSQEFRTDASVGRLSVASFSEGRTEEKGGTCKQHVMNSGSTNWPDHRHKGCTWEEEALLDLVARTN